jgi:SAM-dependent methyltransferase
VSLIDADWNAEWVRTQAGRASRHDSSYWDQRAQDFAAEDSTAALGTSRYAATFIQYMDILPGETVLDIGSGSGTLALPLARAGHPVCAVDFSQGMLSLLRKQAAEEGLRTVVTVQASWEDDWSTAGVSVADVAVASRSMAVADLRAALLKLHLFARRRVCLTVAANAAFLPDLIAGAALGRRSQRRCDHLYVLNILAQMGITAEVRLIRQEWNRAFASVASAQEQLRRLVAPVGNREEELLDNYVAEHLQPTSASDGTALWRLDETLPMRWAFIAWDKGDDERHAGREA